MDYSNITEIKELVKANEVNQLLKAGWKILTQYNHDDNPVFVLAKKEKLRAIARTGFEQRNDELEAVTLNDYLEAGWDLIRDYVVDNREFTDAADQTVVFVMGWYGEEQPRYPTRQPSTALA